MKYSYSYNNPNSGENDLMVWIYQSIRNRLKMGKKKAKPEIVGRSQSLILAEQYFDLLIEKENATRDELYNAFDCLISAVKKEHKDSMKISNNIT